MQGKHDGFLISDLPDGVSAAALAAAVGATGGVVGLETHQIFDHDEQSAIVEHAATARKAVARSKIQGRPILAPRGAGQPELA